MIRQANGFGWIVIAAALFGPSFVFPLGLWASNAGRFVDVLLVSASGLVVLSVGTLVTKSARASQASHLTAAQAAILIFWYWDVFPARWFPNIAWEVCAAVIGVVGAAWVGSRLRSLDWIPLVVGTGLGVAALSMAITGWFGDYRGDAATDIPDSLGLATAGPGGDLLILVVDGFTSPAILKRDFSFDFSPTAEALERAGFDVPDTSYSNYTATYLSLPSLLTLDYLSEADGATDLSSNTATRHAIVTGDDGLMSWMGARGYHVTKFESAWEEDDCVTVETCIRAPIILGVTFRLLVRQSVMRPFADMWLTSPYPANALSVLEQLPAVVADSASNDRSDFIMAHVISPHGPYLLSSDCILNRTPDPVLDQVGSEFVSDEVDEELRLGYVQQVECISSYMEELAEVLTATDMTVLIVGDHGIDSRRQMFRSPASWSDDDLTQRFGIFLATRTSYECDAPSSSLVNVARSIVGCAVGVEIPPVDDRHYASSWDEGPFDVTERMRNLGG